VRHRGEDLRGDLLQRGQQEVHRCVGGIVAEPAAAVEEDPLGHPPGRRQLRARLACPLRDQREDHPLGRVLVQPAPGRDPPDRRADLQPVPQLAQHPRRAHPAGVDHLHLAGCRGRRRGGRVQEPGDGRHQPGQRRPVHLVRPAEAVDHLGDRAAGARVPLVVRQLQVRHHRAVLIDPPGLPKVHAYTIRPSSLLGRPTRRKACAYANSAFPDAGIAVTSANAVDHGLMCS